MLPCRPIVVFMVVLYWTYHTRPLMLSVPFGARVLGESGTFHIGLLLIVRYCHCCADYCRWWM